MKFPVPRLALLFTCAFYLSSCGTGPLVQGPPVQHQVPFHEADYTFAQRSGSGTVSGQLCIKFADGHMIHGRNSKVELHAQDPLHG